MQKENDTSLLVRLPGEMKASVEAIADRERRSVNAQMLVWLERILAESRPCLVLEDEAADAARIGGNGK